MAIRSSRYILLFVLFITILTWDNYAQTATENLSGEIAEYFDPVFGSDQRLISGSFYYDPPRGSVTGTPYYIDESWKKGSVTIDGMVFENLDLKYDIEKNKVVIKFNTVQSSVYQISLRNEKIEQFTLENRLFKPYPGLNSYDTLKFCEVIIEGEISYYLLQTKSLILANGSGFQNYYYKINTKQFLLIGNDLIPFRSKNSLYKRYPLVKKELKQFRRSEKLAPLKKNIADRGLLVGYCNKLISAQN